MNEECNRYLLEVIKTYRSINKESVKIGQHNVVEIKEKGHTRRRADCGKEYTTRHSKGYVNHAATKLLSTRIVPENARPALKEKGDPWSRIWVQNPATRLNRGVSSRTPGGIKRT